VYRFKRRNRIRIRLSRKSGFIAAALAVLVGVWSLFILLTHGCDGYENIAKDRFQCTFDTVTASVLSDYDWNGSALPEASALSACKADILDNLRDELKGPKLEFVSADRLFTEGKSSFIKVPQLVMYSSRIKGYYIQDYCESGINMGVYTISFVAEASMSVRDSETVCTAECIVYRCFVEGEVPDNYYDDLFE